MTPATLRLAMPFAGDRVQTFAQPLTDAMVRWQIDTPARQAAFLANIAAETASLSQLRERSDGAAYEPPSALAADLGNTHAGDGALFIGRGCLQITGRAGYIACGQGLQAPLLTSPELLEQPQYAALSGAWYFAHHGCNEMADGDPNHFGAICRRINGGFNGIDERIGCWIRARAALGLRP
ncbi:MAG: glycoside hydrolase family 19 protein [Steroidobacteraceae bacterium]